MYTGHCSFLNIVHAILPCEQAGPKDPIGRKYEEKADRVHNVQETAVPRVHYRSPCASLSQLRPPPNRLSPPRPP